MASSVYVESSVRVTAARIAGVSAEMDRVANKTLRSVKAAASAHKDTGSFIRSLSVQTVPGLQGNGRLVDDRIVVSTDPGALAIEYGHIVRIAGARRVKYIPGQHNMKRGMEAVR